MKMKNLQIAILGLSLLFSISCDLDKEPLGTLNEATYWTSSDDLKMFANQFYGTFPGFSGYVSFPFDAGTDNFLSGDPSVRLMGSTKVPESGDLGYDVIRSLNYFLENCGKAKGNAAEINRYIGEVKFFRAYHYFARVRTYGDVVWVNRVLPADLKELQIPKTPRHVVIDSVIRDLDFAIQNLPGVASPSCDKRRVYKEIALLLKSRVCLFEGTWQKYHKLENTGFATTNDSQKYLQMAAEAAEAIINTGRFAIYKTGNSDKDYASLFVQNDYSNISEAMLWRSYAEKYTQGHAIQHGTQRLGWDTGVPVEFINDYLCSDGKPIGLSPNYPAVITKYFQYFQNRDPRLTQTVCPPGVRISPNEISRTFPKIEGGGQESSKTGFNLYKGLDPSVLGSSSSTYTGRTGFIVFRYAEVLLNYAEAKAELGLCDQAVLDKSINQLRSRVGMPSLTPTPDADPANPYKGQISNLLYEIRRERRVELAHEGFRFMDLARWAAFDEYIVGKRPHGAQITGTDLEAVCLSTDINPATNPFYYMAKKIVFSTNTTDASIYTKVRYIDADGRLDPYRRTLLEGGNKTGAYDFKVNRDYLSPIPTQDITLSGGTLTQNPGW